MSAATSTDRTYTVTGMTCGHCVMSVTEEVSEVEGVTGVDIDLASGRLSVSGEGFSDEAIRTAVGDAGYEVAS
jgi:copper chaperone